MGVFTDAAKNTMLDALVADRVQLHSGAPGVNGTDNVIAGTYVAAVFDAAVAGARALNADIDYSGLTPLQSITYVTVWNHNGGTPIFEGSDDLSGDLAANAAGEYTLSALTSALSLSDV